MSYILSKGIVCLLALLMSASLATAVANFDVNTFSCSPSEVAINEVFSCTAQVKNNGDAAGSVTTLRLYPDSNNWLEQANYVQSSGTSVNPGQTFEVTFTGMRATKAGNNGFSRISLDNEDDTWVADNNIKENVIDVSLTVATSASSANTGATFTATPEVTAGGNIDVTLTLTVDSGGCGIGNQNSQKSTTGLQNQQKWTPSSWTVTEGSGGNCVFTISAAATGANGVASKTVSQSKTVTCSNCSSGGGSGSSGAGGTGGGGGGVGVIVATVELDKAVQQELGAGQSLRFSFGEEEHTVTVQNLTETTAVIIVRSREQTFTLTVGEERTVDFEGDGKDDVNVRLKSINIIKKKALIILTPLYVPAAGSGGGATGGAETPQQQGETGRERSGEGEEASPIGLITNRAALFWLALGILIAGIIVIVAYIGWQRRRQRKFERSVILRRFGKK